MEQQSSLGLGLLDIIDPSPKIAITIKKIYLFMDTFIFRLNERVASPSISVFERFRSDAWDKIFESKYDFHVDVNFCFVRILLLLTRNVAYARMRFSLSCVFPQPCLFRFCSKLNVILNLNIFVFLYLEWGSAYTLEKFLPVRSLVLLCICPCQWLCFSWHLRG